MYSLFIDTHDEEIIIALYEDKAIKDFKKIVSRRSHSDYTMPVIKDILDKHEITVHNLNEILVVIGPGSFTGVRLGVTIAKTLAYTLNIPIKEVTSLQCKAISYDSNKKKAAIINDLKGVFIGIFNEKNELINDYQYINNDDYQKFLKNNDIPIVENVDYDFAKIYAFMENINPSMVHMVNPLYIKVIEALK